MARYRLWPLGYHNSVRLGIFISAPVHWAYAYVLLPMTGISPPSIWLASAACIFLTSGIVWQKLCKSRPGWIKELDALGRPRKQKLHGTAVVCGGSIAGNITARILADHFERVILVDPEIQDTEKPKTRIMQYNAAHVFLSLFVEGARRLWPNFDAEFQTASGRLVPADMQIHYSGVLLLAPYEDYPLGCLPDTLAVRRSTAQKVLSRLLMQHSTARNITVLPGAVRGVQASADMTSIQSATVRKVDGTEAVLNDVALIADCTGTTQAGLKWLRNAGFPLPENIRCSYDANLRYTTLCFMVAPEVEAMLPIPEHAKNKVLVYGTVQDSDYGAYGAALMKTDANTMQLILQSCGDELPRAAADIVPFISGFRVHTPIPSWFLDTLEILCERGNPSFDNIKIPAQSYIRYHSVPAGALPANFVAIGDSNLQLNPIHGQGFTKIVLNGVVLNSLLTTMNPSVGVLPRDFSSRYFKNNAAYTQGLWDGTRLHDYGSASCEPMEGETKDRGRFVRWFEMKLVSAATQDAEVASALWHVRHLLKADRVLLAPTVLWKVLWTRSRF
ncbi:hypothetical protein FB451DRAFT_1284592 [Mycena latifolia]|nr:hypothetical protein FB451DRAFT_1284592 [Mycena latifolia]